VPAAGSNPDRCHFVTALKFFSKPSLVPGTRSRSFRCSDCRKAGVTPTRSQTMKQLTTLPAVAAVIAGISVAQAQGTMGSPSGSMQKAQTVGNSAFCINMSGGGGLNCKYASMAACEKDAKPQNLSCSPNPNKSTTGSKQ
jgi:hypothetical protein